MEEKPVTRIQTGDALISESGIRYWTATGNAVLKKDGTVEVPVRYVDGGLGVRVWDDPKTTLPLTRGARSR